MGKTHRMGLAMYCDKYESPMGTLWLTGNDNALTGLSFEEKTGTVAAPDSFASVRNWLDAYFRCEVVQPVFPMQLDGPPFQKLIWRLLLDIPYGETKTYGDLAREAARIMGKEKMSAQAVGQAVGCNPIAIIIPCHRCIGSGGRLTGYAYGLERKEWLLNHER